MALSGAAAADAALLTGVVFEDLDGDGLKDEREPGIAGVKVSNGAQILLSDAGGEFQLPITPGQTAFVIKPRGFKAPGAGNAVPPLWRHHRPQGSPALRYGGIAAVRADTDRWLIPLQRQPAGAVPFEVLVFGDPQPKTTTDVDYYARDIVQPLVGVHRARLGLSLGDIVDDDLSLLADVNAETARLGVPWLHVAGNHDLDFDAVDDDHSLLSFRQVYGPDTYAWEEPEVSFVLLDDVVYLPGQRPEYIGGLREDQFGFLAAYLATLPVERPLVIALHIPLFDTREDRETFRRGDRERLFELLRPFRRVLVLSAHGHVQRHVLHGVDSGWQGAAPLHEYNVGAACGGFWSGVADAEGIPSATMADGTPNGYATLGLDEAGDFVLRWFAAREPETYQIALHAPKVLRQGAYPAFAVHANVFMGRDDTRVEYRIDGGDWKPMQRVAKADPRVVAENAADDASEVLRGYDRTPGAADSQHLWRGSLPTDLAVGEHRIEVRAEVPWRGWHSAETSYRLERVERVD